MADVLLADLEDRFAVANGETRRDFVRLESCSLIAKALSLKEDYHRKSFACNVANNDKSIINNRLAGQCQFLSLKSFV